MPKPNPLTAALRTSVRAPAAPRRTEAAESGRSDGRRLVGGHFPAPVHRQLRMLAAKEDRAMQSLLAEALNELFAKRGLPPIA